MAAHMNRLISTGSYEPADMNRLLSTGSEALDASPCHFHVIFEEVGVERIKIVKILLCERVDGFLEGFDGGLLEGIHFIHLVGCGFHDVYYCKMRAKG